MTKLEEAEIEKAHQRAVELLVGLRTLTALLEETAKRTEGRIGQDWLMKWADDHWAAAHSARNLVRQADTLTGDLDPTRISLMAAQDRLVLRAAVAGIAHRRRDQAKRRGTA